MDRTNRAVASRRSRTNARNARGTYIDGNAVRKIQEMPSRQRSSSPGRRTGRARTVSRPASQSERRVRQVSRETIRNRQKAKSMGRGFVVFLTAVCVAILFFTVNYLQLKSDITDNDAYYSQVTSNVDLNKIKKIAIGRLGMNYPTDEQKKKYTMSNNSYVRQYQDIPENRR